MAATLPPEVYNHYAASLATMTSKENDAPRSVTKSMLQKGEIDDITWHAVYVYSAASSTLEWGLRYI